MVELHELLSANPDLSIYEIQEGDHETSATLSVADLKELLLAVNVCSRRIHALRSDLEAAELAGLKHDVGYADCIVTGRLPGVTNAEMSNG